MRLGYACINTEMPTKFRACRVATVEKQGVEIIKELALENFQQTKKAIEWNIKNEIYFYRLSSDIVPLATHPINTWVWYEDEDVLKITKEIKELKEKHNIRLSCHPGQYTVINSKNPEIVEKSIKDLIYHDILMELVGGTDIILHVGGVYGDKASAKKRFCENYLALPKTVKEKLRLENDDVSYCLEDVVEIYKQAKVPICFDYHHERCNPSEKPLQELIKYVFESWNGYGIPKMHLSSGKTSPTDRSHHDYVFKEDLEKLMEFIKNKDVDIMLEAKLKEQAVLNLKK